MFQRMLDHTHKLRSASHSLEDLFDKYAPTPDLNRELKNLTKLMYNIIIITIGSIPTLFNIKFSCCKISTGLRQEPLGTLPHPPEADHTHSHL